MNRSEGRAAVESGVGSGNRGGLAWPGLGPPFSWTSTSAPSHPLMPHFSIHVATLLGHPLLPLALWGSNWLHVSISGSQKTLLAPALPF